MSKVLQITLGILTAIGGFVDVGAVATSGEAGAKFGLGLLWAMLLGTLAIMLLLTMVGRFTAVSGKTYADALRERFGFKLFLLPLASELLANSLMLAAEIGGIAIALSLFTGVNWHYLVPVAALLVWVMAWYASFGLIENGPALLGLVTLAFPVGIVVLGGPSHQLLATAWHPDIKDGTAAEYLFLAAAILGAIISPYLVYFYSSGAREEQWTKRSLIINRVTATIGMSFGSVTAIAIIILSAMVLHPLHMSASTLGEVGISMAAAFGTPGSLLFAAALLITCFGAALEVSLAVPYEVSQGLGWEWGEEKRPAQAPRYYVFLLGYLVVGLGISALGIDPLQLTLYASALTALLLPISLLPFLLLMNDAEYLRGNTNGMFTNVATIGVLVIAFIVSVVSLPLIVVTGGG